MTAPNGTLRQQPMAESYYVRARTRRAFMPPGRKGRRGRDSDLTVGQVAAFLGTAPRTIAKWIDAGKLAGYRYPTAATAVAGHSGDRRVPLDKLWAFCTAHGIPTERLPPLNGLVVAVGFAEANRLAVPPGWETLAVPDWVALGFRLRGRTPGLWVIDWAAGGPEAERAVRYVRLVDEHVPIVRVLGEDATAEAVKGTTDFRRPFDADKLVSWVARTLAG